MADAVVYRGTTDGVRFIPDSPGAFRFALKPFAGKEIEVLFREFKKTRSNQQNKYWFGIVIKLFMEYMGERDKLFVHRAVLLEIGHYEVVNGLRGKEKKELPTHNLKTGKFLELCQAAQELGAQFGLVIPDPDSAQAVGMMD